MRHGAIYIHFIRPRGPAQPVPHGTAPAGLCFPRQGKGEAIRHISPLPGAWQGQAGGDTVVAGFVLRCWGTPMGQSRRTGAGPRVAGRTGGCRQPGLEVRACGGQAGWMRWNPSSCGCQKRPQSAAWPGQEGGGNGSRDPSVPAAPGRRPREVHTEARAVQRALGQLAAWTGLL